MFWELIWSVNKKNTTFAYGFDNQRRKMEYIDASGNTKTTYYIGDNATIHGNLIWCLIILL